MNERLAIRLLEKLGHRLRSVHNGLEVLAALAGEELFDVILMDVQMPEMDGLQCARAIRSQGLDVPIVAMTAHAMESDRQACLLAGMDDYVSKPIHPAGLSAALQRAAGRRPQEVLESRPL